MAGEGKQRKAGCIAGQAGTGCGVSITYRDGGCHAAICIRLWGHLQRTACAGGKDLPVAGINADGKICGIVIVCGECASLHISIIGVGQGDGRPCCRAAWPGNIHTGHSALIHRQAGWVLPNARNRAQIVIHGAKQAGDVAPRGRDCSQRHN
ncbi:MAG: hypothetical protein Alpg2KO_26450 [Alphaproteobacteria bacterium]